MPRPGEVFYLPREAREDREKGDRPYVLMSVCEPNSEVVTLAYGSTKSTDAQRGAEHVILDPSTSQSRDPGLAHLTFIYTSRLVNYATAALGKPRGKIDD